MTRARKRCKAGWGKGRPPACLRRKKRCRAEIDVWVGARQVVGFTGGLPYRARLLRVASMAWLAGCACVTRRDDATIEPYRLQHRHWAGFALISQPNRGKRFPECRRIGCATRQRQGESNPEAAFRSLAHRLRDAAAPRGIEPLRALRSLAHRLRDAAAPRGIEPLRALRSLAHRLRDAAAPRGIEP